MISCRLPSNSTRSTASSRCCAPHVASRSGRGTRSRTAPEARVTENGTQIIEAPKFLAEMAQMSHNAPQAHRMAPAGSLESTLATLTELVAQENQKTVVLECTGLQLVPAALSGDHQECGHSIDSQCRDARRRSPSRAQQRRQAAASAALHLEFKIACRTAVSNCISRTTAAASIPTRCAPPRSPEAWSTQDAADRLRDRQAIKLIFKSGFTTMADQRRRSPAWQRHVAGAALRARSRRQDCAGDAARSRDALQGHAAGCCGRRRLARATRKWP